MDLSANLTYDLVDDGEVLVNVTNFMYFRDLNDAEVKVIHEIFDKDLKSDIYHIKFEIRKLENVHTIDLYATLKDFINDEARLLMGIFSDVTGNQDDGLIVLDKLVKEYVNMMRKTYLDFFKKLEERVRGKNE